MQNATPRWIKPELVRLGKIADVAGQKTTSADGGSGNLHS